MFTNFARFILITICLPMVLLAQENHITSANSLAEQGKYDEALKEVNLEIASHPNSARAYNLRGHLYIIKGDNQNAIADLSKVISLAPQQAKPYVDRAVIHYKMGNKGLALSDIEKAEQIAPTNPWVVGVKEKISGEKS